MMRVSFPLSPIQVFQMPFAAVDTDDKPRPWKGPPPRAQSFCRPGCRIPVNSFPLSVQHPAVRGHVGFGASTHHKGFVFQMFRTDGIDIGAYSGGMNRAEPVHVKRDDHHMKLRCVVYHIHGFRHAFWGFHENRHGVQRVFNHVAGFRYKFSQTLLHFF